MSSVVEQIRRELASKSDAESAEQQQAYMKSQMPYRGVRMPEVRRLTKAAVRNAPFTSQDGLVATVLELWDDASFREERYAALTVLQVPAYRRWRDVTLLPLYDHLVVTGRWWDLVDDVSTHAIGELLLTFPTDVAPVIRSWAGDGDLWRRRAALVCQVGAKASTDVRLLSDVITAALTAPDELRRDFFVRKGIGWALRSHSVTDPEWVRAFVDEHRAELSPLSVREATKHL